MKPLAQAIQVARTLLAEGKTGSNLADGLRPVVSTLSSADKTRLASLISREYFILGHAAHDPNLYKTCNAAKIAKQKSLNPELKLLTYKTPMCASCGFNRAGSCGLMGGRLVAGPEEVPEKVVHRTADLLIADRVVSQDTGRGIALGSGTATARLANLHFEKTQTQNQVDTSRDQLDFSRSRVASAMLDPAESEPIRPLALTGSARKMNAERFGLGSVDEQEDAPVHRTARKINNMIGDDLNIYLPPEPSRVAGSVDIDGSPDFTIPSFSRQAGDQRDLREEQSRQAQKYLIQMARRASRMLGAGKMTIRAANKLFHGMNQMLDLGAVSTEKTAAIQRQLNTLGGGMEL
jgi:hypothetical protein